MSTTRPSGARSGEHTHAWVLGTAVVLAVGSIESGGGRLLAGSVGCVVAGVAAAQARALRNARRVEGDLRPADELAPPVEAIRIDRPSSLDPERLWGSVADHGLFGRLARNLDRVEVLGGEGLGLSRRCVANNGSSWVEQCTIWEPGRRPAVEVDTSDYPYPLQLVACQCYLNARTGSGQGPHRVGLVFQLRARPGMLGQLFVLGVHLRRPTLVRIVRGWIATAETTEGVPA